MIDHPAPRWRKASASASNGSCVELAELGPELRGVRDSKDPEGPHLTLSSAALAALIQGAKAGEFDDLT